MRIKLFTALLTTVLLYYLSIYFGFTVLWLFTIFMSVIIILSLVMILVARASLQFQQRITSPIIEKGMHTDIFLECKNGFIFIYPGVELCYADGKKEQITVFPGIHQHNIVFKPKLKGIYQISLEKIKVRDFFGLFQYTIRLNSRDKVYVLPAIREISFTDKVQTKGNVNRQTNVQTTEDKNIISDLREYKFGDTLNRINWKATAKYNEVIVNNYENRFCEKTFLYVGGVWEEDEEESLLTDDFACEIAVTLIHKILEDGGQVTLFYEGKNEMIDSEKVQATSEYGMYLTERTASECYNQDFILIERILFTTAEYNKVIFVVKQIHDELYRFAKALAAHNVELEVLQIARIDNQRLQVSKADLLKTQGGQT